MATRSQLRHAFYYATLHLSNTHVDNEREGKFEYICWAMQEAMEKGLIKRDTFNAAREIISERILHHTTFEGWMGSVYPELHAAIIHDRTHNMSRKLQRTRKAWLKSLVKEFSKKATRR